MSLKILRVNCNDHTHRIEETPQSWQGLGGRGLIARIAVDEIVPTCYSLGAKNKLIFAPGLLVGHMLSSCDRISIGGKSPLTGGIKESNAGGTTGLSIARLGFKAVILEDIPQKADWKVLYISSQEVRFDPADALAGLGVYASAEKLREKYGKKAAYSIIGPAGEHKMWSAGISNVDKEGVPSRLSGRGGMGAVMGSKGIKAVVFDAVGLSNPALAHAEDFQAAKKIFTKSVMEHPQSAVYHDYGTAAMARTTNALGAIPTRGFSQGRFDKVETISGEYMYEMLKKRGGVSKTSHACMPGCAIQCSNVVGDENGEDVIVAPLEYETIGLMGSNLDIADLDTIAWLNWHANDIGVDSIEAGAALGVAARAGVLQFGDGEGALRLMDQIRQATPLGRILGSGAQTTGNVFAIEQVPVVKGQSMPAYDPRALKGTGITYATSPQGADHTCGVTARAKIDHLNPQGQADLSRTLQINMAGYDTLGACIFSGFGFSLAPDIISKLLNARYGWQVGEDVLQSLGRQTLVLEREFNRGAGFTNAHDRLPEWMTKEALPPHDAVFDVSEEDLDGIFNWS